MEFLRNFHSSSCSEHLIIWLSQYPIAERIKILDFSQRKLDEFLETFSSEDFTHESCKCRSLFEALPPMRPPLKLRYFEECIDDKPATLDTSMLPKLREYVEYNQQIEPQKSDKQEQSELQAKPLKCAKTHKRPQKIYCVQRKPLDNFQITKLSLLDALILYDSPLSMSNLERIFPPSWRSYDRSAWDKFKLTPNIFLSFFENMLYKYPSMYFFPTVIECKHWSSRRACGDDDNNTLPRELLQKFKPNDLIVQPNLCGFHVVVHKYNKHVYFYSQYGIKLRIPFKMNLATAFKSQQFFGEFMILPIKDSEYLHKRYQSLTSDFKFILLDLYDYGGINWCDCSYQQRQMVCAQFVSENPEVVLIPIIENISQLETTYRKEFALRTYPHFSGVVFRPKNELRSRQVYKYIFENPAMLTFTTRQSGIHWNPDSYLNLQRETVFVAITSKYTMLVPFVVADENKTLKQTPEQIPNKPTVEQHQQAHTSHREVLLLCFDGFKFVPFQKIIPRDAGNFDTIYKPTSTARLCIVHRKQIPYGILKIRYNVHNNLGGDVAQKNFNLSHKNVNLHLGGVVSIEPQFDKTLLDCVKSFD